MAQGLKRYIVAEDPSLVSSTHIRQLTATITPVPGLQHLLATTVSSYIHVHIAPHRHILIHIIENKGSVVEGAEYGSLCLYSSI